MSEENCPPACRAKIILNGGRVIGEINSVKDLVNNGTELTEEEGFLLIEILDQAEDRLIEFNNMILSKTGYKRRTNKFPLKT
jgi:hypothetical protein